MSDISLSKAVRSNLLSLQHTSKMMGITQERLATGNKVNSALDNPTNFFTASALNSRAGDLGALLDSMANGIQTLEAADNGLSSITKTLEQMQSVLRQARQDKSFQTSSYEISPSATGNLSFSGGALGALTRSVGLENLGLTNTALGLASAPAAGTAGQAAIPGTDPGTAGSAAFTFGAGGTLDTGDSIGLAVTVNGAVQNITIAANEVTGPLDAAQFRSLLGSKLTGVTVGGTGSNITLTSNTTGGTSSVSIAPATLTDTDNSSFANAGALNAALGIGAGIAGTPGAATGGVIPPGTAATHGTQSFAWAGNTVEVNKDAVISLTATINGTPQSIEITRKDVMRVGNGDGTINSASEFAAILAARIEGVTASATGNTITIQSDTTGTGSTVALSAATVTGRTYNADEMVQRINTDPDLKGRIRASNDDGKLRIENQSTQELSVIGVNSAGLITGTATDAKITGNTVRADLTKQYNELRDQFDKLSDDASFNGINLLRGDLLTITFNETGTSSIDVQTKDQQALNAAKLNLFDIAPEDLDMDADIDELLVTVKSALSHVRTQASTFGQNLSIVENRQDFTKNMINTLETGAANLTLADMNEEAANLLALQTRQQLSSNSLSLASQADQSVLQLLR